MSSAGAEVTKTSEMAPAAVVLKGDLASNVAGSLTRGARRRWWVRSGTKGRGFHYETAQGERITDETEIERIRSLIIPPAWKEVRISPSARSRLQAIGLDARGRVQRIYHPSFVARQRRRKYEKTERFGRELAKLRKRANEDISLEGLPRERVLAVVVRLINDLYFRVGSEESVKRYRTYGITTLRNRHLEIKRGGRLVFSFVGKHQVHHRRILVDEELAALLREIQNLRGVRLFQYLDGENKLRAITPRDVNEYIKSAVGAEFSAKDFRTWGGTLLCAIKLAELGGTEEEKQKKRYLTKAVKYVAERLGNTPTVCRNCYIHPTVLESYLKGITLEEFRPRRERSILLRQQPEYEVEELALLKLFAAQSNGKG